MASCARVTRYEDVRQALQSFQANGRRAHSSLYWLPDTLRESAEAGRLTLCMGNTALLLLRDEGTHYACQLVADERFDWPLPPMEKPVVCELVYTDRRPLPQALTHSLLAGGLSRLRTTLRFTCAPPFSCDMPPEVRPATADDLPAVCALLQAYFDPRLDFIPQEAELCAALATGALLVLPQGDKTTGFVYAPVERNRGTLRHIAVAEGYRGRGLAKPLMRAALARFAACGAKSAELWSGAGNETAHHLYRAFGFAPDGRMADEYTI